MRRFAFRLDAVLRVRRLQEELARAAVATADAELAAARTVAATRLARLRDTVPVPGPVDGASFLAGRDTLARRADAATRAAGAVADAGERRAERLSAWGATHRAVAGLERVEARARDEHGIEVRRDEDRQVDELVVTRARGGRS